MSGGFGRLAISGAALVASMGALTGCAITSSHSSAAAPSVSYQALTPAPSHTASPSASPGSGDSVKGVFCSTTSLTTVRQAGRSYAIPEQAMAAGNKGMTPSWKIPKSGWYVVRENQRVEGNRTIYTDVLRSGTHDTGVAMKLANGRWIMWSETNCERKG